MWNFRVIFFRFWGIFRIKQTEFRFREIVNTQYSKLVQFPPLSCGRGVGGEVKYTALTKKLELLT